MSEKGTPTRYPGVTRLSDGRFRLRGRTRIKKTGKTVDLDRIVGPKDAEPVHDEHEASRRRVTLLAELEGPREVPRAHQSVTDYAALWLDSKLPTLKASTRALYEGVLATCLEVEVSGHKLGDHLIEGLTAKDLVEWRDAQVGVPGLRTGRPPKATTINGRIRILKEMISDAVADLGLPVDPTRRLEPLREPRAGRKSLTADELRAFLAAAFEHAPQWHPFFLFLACTGLRFGEATALRWQDLDEAAGTISVSDGQWHGVVDDTKTGTTRVLPYPPELAAVMATYRERRREAILKRLKRRKVPDLAEALESGDQFVFPSRQPGKYMYNTAPRKALLLCLEKAGIERRFTIHGFRHTFNNLVRQTAEGKGQGIVLRAMTGHSSVAMSERYSEVEIEEKRRAVAGYLRLVQG